jgi:D-alanine-D-alanine ligase
VLALVEAPLVPPDDASAKDATAAPWKTEFDVIRTLRPARPRRARSRRRHRPGPHPRRRRHCEARRVFNLLEDFDDVPIYDQNVVSYLELLRVPYTGCNPRGLILSRDKALAKKILSYHRVRCARSSPSSNGPAGAPPEAAAVPADRQVAGEGRLRGIAQTSLVDSDEKLAERVRFVHERLAPDAIVERYIDGRELYVGVLGNHRLRVLPVWELSFRKLPEDAPPHRHREGQMGPALSAQDRRQDGARPRSLPEPLVHHIKRLCRRIYRVLEITGYARIDFRLTPDGQV